MALHPQDETLFRSTYAALALLGFCDEPGGAEYRRVWLEWQLGDWGMDPEEFIRRRANITAGEPKNGK